MVTAHVQFPRSCKTQTIDPERLVFKGVLLQTLGRNAAAEETFAAAEAEMGQEGFLIARSQRYLDLGQTQAALADAQAVVGLNPDSAMGYLMLGRAYEKAGNCTQAVDAYTRASTLAEAQKNLEIAAIARVQLGMLMQIPSTSTGTGP